MFECVEGDGVAEFYGDNIDREIKAALAANKVPVLIRVCDQPNGNLIDKFVHRMEKPPRCGDVVLRDYYQFRIIRTAKRNDRWEAWAV